MNSNNFEIYNNYTEPVCIFANSGDFVYKNKIFEYVFGNIKSFDRFKKRFNFNICFLSTENIISLTPLDLVINSNENFHTYCTYQTLKEEYYHYYIYSFKHNGLKVLVFKDITTNEVLNNISSKYSELSKKYKEVVQSTEKYTKLQEHSQNQVLKMAIINRISMVIRETNNMDSILTSALNEIHTLLGSFKTYFSLKEKNAFRIISCVNNQTDINIITEYEDDVLQLIKNKEITVTSSLKEYLNSESILPKGVKRIIIPVHDKNKLLGIIVTFTKQKFQTKDNREILQSIAVQLSSSIIQADLIQQLNRKNKKLEKTLLELKETQLHLINSEKMASLGQLVSGVAHEINTPLASISSNNDLIHRILKSDNIDEKKLNMIKELNEIDIEAAGRISNIVKSLKRFVRLDEAEFQEADINKELDLTLKLTAHELKNNIEVIKNYSDLPPVLCSVNMLNQVFMNLIVNACHSIKEKNTNGIIKISTKVKDNNLIVIFNDDGMGIPQNIQNKIFNVGFTTKKIGIGTGLGLSISRKIIELHKGTIAFNSKQGIGTEFIITIPLSKN